MYLGVARQPKTKRKRPSLLASFSSSIKPSAIAATFLLALELVHGLGVELPTCAREALALTGVSRSQAYEMKGRLRNQLEQLHESPGRPMADAPEPQELYQVASLVRDYVMDHPGSVHTRGARRSYTENFGSSDESVGNPREDLGQIDGACRSVVTAKKWKVEARCYGQEGCGWVLGDGWGDPFGEGR